MKLEKVAFRVDGGDQIGMGHVVECLQLGRILKERYGVRPYFLIARDEAAKCQVRDWDFPVIELPKGESELDSLKKMTQELGIRKLILNLNKIHHGYPAELKKIGFSLINMVENGKDPNSDLVIDLTKEPWLMMLDPVFSKVSGEKKIRSKAERGLIAFGANDPLGLTLRVVRALGPEPWIRELVVITGMVFKRPMELNELRQRFPSLIHLQNLSLEEVAQQMLLADVAVTAGGDMMYELVTVGTPAVVLCPLEKQLAASQFFRSQGVIDCLGLHSQVSDRELVQRVRSLAQDLKRRQFMSKKGRSLMDGQGVYRVAEKIAKLWEIAAVS